MTSDAPLAGARFVGQPTARREDRQHLAGTARFTADFTERGQLHAVFVRSTEAHARVTNIDTAEAAAVPGVAQILTARDLADRPPMNVTWLYPDAAEKVTRPPLLTDNARYVGDPVAVVLADDEYIATDAAELVLVDYEPLPAVTDARDAIAPGAVQLHDQAPGNLSFEQRFVNGDVAAAFENADVVVEGDVRNQRLIPSPLEPRAISVLHDAVTGMLTVYLSTQAPHVIKHDLCAIAGIPEHRLRVIAPNVGGGFGAKLAFYREDAVVTIAAARLRRGVRWVETRHENVVATTHGRDHHQHYRAAAAADGRLLGVQVDCLANLGAYLSSMGQGVPGTNFGAMVGGNYDIPAIDIRVRGVLTNTTSTDTYRGAGRPEATHLTERIIEHVARATGVAPTEVRRRNFLTGLPRPNAVGLITYDSGDYHDAYDRLLALLDIDRERARQRGLRAAGRHMGIGTAMYVEFTGVGRSELNRAIGFDRGGFDQTLIRMHPDGTATVFSGLSAHGQGHLTTLAQAAGERLRLDPERIEVLQSDTLTAPLGFGTFNSRSMPVGTGSVAHAADKIIDKARRIAAELLEAAVEDVELTDAGFGVIGGPASAVPWSEVAAHAYAGSARTGIEPGLEATAAFEPTGLACAYGAHAAIVEVDVDTGDVRLDRVVVVDDCGPVLNPLIATGQIHGGLAQGIGQALYEGIDYDDHGQPLASGFESYTVPRAEHFCTFETSHTVHPSPLNPLGVKGVGEAGTVGIVPAVHAAVLDALEPLGVEHLDMPLTPARIWTAIDQARRHE